MTKTAVISNLQTNCKLLRDALEHLHITHQLAEQASLAPVHLQSIAAAIEDARSIYIDLKVIITRLEAAANRHT